MVSMECPCEFRPALAPEFDIQIVAELDGDVNTPGVSMPEEASADWEPTFDEGAFGLVADGRRDSDEDDDSDSGVDDFGDEPEDDDMADDLDDDDDDNDDLDGDLDDLDDDDVL